MQEEIHTWLTDISRAIHISDSRKIADTRNRIIHGYDTVSDEIIWGIVNKSLPILAREVNDLLGRL